MPVLQLICYNSGTLKTCSNLLLTNQSLLLWHFNSNVSMMFIYAIYPISFGYGILLKVMSKCFADFTEQEHLQ